MPKIIKKFYTNWCDTCKKQNDMLKEIKRKIII